MLTARTNGGRQMAVRLSDVPLTTRRRFGQRLYEAAVADRDLLLASELHSAIEAPSDRVYWLPERAVRKVLK